MGQKYTILQIFMRNPFVLCVHYRFRGLCRSLGWNFSLATMTFLIANQQCRSIEGKIANLMRIPLLWAKAQYAML